MITARKYIRIGGKMYKPGDEIPQEAMNNEQWKHLFTKKAITGSHDPVEAVLDDGEEAPEQEEPDTVPEENGAVEDMPVQVKPEVPKMPAKPKSQKPGKGKAGTDVEKEPDLPSIDMAGLVVDKKEE